MKWWPTEWSPSNPSEFCITLPARVSRLRYFSLELGSFSPNCLSTSQAELFRRRKTLGYARCSQAQLRLKFLGGRTVLDPTSIYRRVYEGVNYRLRTFAGGHYASACRPVSIVLLLTERCNARCIHCDIWK